MNISPPKDKTSIKINGEIINGEIKNPIKFTPPSNNYKSKVIPKRIKIDTSNVDINKEVSKSSLPNHNKLYSSKNKIISNKQEILDKLFNIDNPIEKVIVPEEKEKVIIPEEKVIIPEEKVIIPEEKVIVPEEKVIVPEEKFPNIELLLDDKSNKKNPVIKPKRIKKVVKKSVKKNNNIPNYERMSESDKMIHRNDFIIKFDLLRKWHPSLNIQKGIEHHPNLELVHSVYELYLGCIYNEINSNFYRGALLVTWLGLELFGVYVLGVDTSDYLKTQISLMWAYEPIINELSKVNFYHIAKDWSPFQKLIGIVFGSYVFIILVKLALGYISKKVGANLDGMTSTVVNFISSMIFTQPKENSIPSIIINNNTNSESNNVSMSNNLGGIHNVTIPQSSSMSSNSQINMANGVLGAINAITGRGDNKTASKNEEPKTNKSRLVSPSF